MYILLECGIQNDDPTPELKRMHLVILGKDFGMNVIQSPLKKKLHIEQG
jgi:hypothetical protein